MPVRVIEYTVHTPPQAAAGTRRRHPSCLPGHDLLDDAGVPALDSRVAATRGGGDCGDVIGHHKTRHG